MVVYMRVALLMRKGEDEGLFDLLCPPKQHTHHAKASLHAEHMKRSFFQKLLNPNAVRARALTHPRPRPPGPGPPGAPHAHSSIPPTRGRGLYCEWRSRRLGWLSS